MTSIVALAGSEAKGEEGDVRWWPACCRRNEGAGSERRRDIRLRRVVRVVLEGRVKGIATNSVSLCALPDLREARWKGLLSPLSSLTMICMFSAESEEDEVAEAFDAERERMVAKVVVDGRLRLGLRCEQVIEILMEAANVEFDRCGQEWGELNSRGR